MKRSIDFFKQMGLFLRREIPVRISRFFRMRLGKNPFSAARESGSAGAAGRSIIMERDIQLPVERNRLGDNFPVYFQVKFPLIRFSVRLFIEPRLPAETGLEFRAETRVPGLPGFLMEFLYRRHEERLLAALDRKANLLLLEALARRPAEKEVGFPLDEYDEPDFRPEAWPERFPSENPNNFKEPLSPRSILKKWPPEILTGSKPTPRTREYFRRLSIIPMTADEESIRGVIPPTFIFPPGAAPTLYLIAALDAGTDQEVLSGREHRIILTLYCPVGVVHGSDFETGWLPLFSTWTPCLRPTLPGDPYTVGYPFGAGGIKIGLGDARRKAMWMNSYTPTRTIQARDTLPGPIAYERNLYTRDQATLNIRRREEHLEFAVNRVYFMRRTPPLSRTGTPTAAVAGAATWFSEQLGLDLRETDYAYFLTSMSSTSEESIIPLHRTQFRSGGAAHPGRPIYHGEKAGII